MNGLAHRNRPAPACARPGSPGVPSQGRSTASLPIQPAMRRGRLEQEAVRRFPARYLPTCPQLFRPPLSVPCRPFAEAGRGRRRAPRIELDARRDFVPWHFSAAGRRNKWRLRPVGGRIPAHNRTRAPQQTSGRAFPAVSFVYLSVECPPDKFHGINCRPKLDAKLLDRFFHGGRQVSPPFDGLRLIAASTVRSISSIAISRQVLAIALSPLLQQISR